MFFARLRLVVECLCVFFSHLLYALRCFLDLRFRQAAACELEEEAHLHEGTWHPLMKNAETVAGAGKYSTQIFHPYLVVDPVVKGEPRALDDGEFIEYIRGVSLEEVGEGRQFPRFLFPTIDCCWEESGAGGDGAALFFLN